MMPTAAQTYLQALVEQHPLRNLPADLTQAVTGDLCVPPQKLHLDLRDRVLDLLSELQSSLPPIVQQLLRDGHLVVGEIGADVPNAHVTRLDGDQFVVVLHSGLFAFLYRVARPLASAVFRSTADAGAGIDTPELARIIAEVFWWQQETGDSFGPEYEVTLGQKQLANILAMRAERFLLAHELGHVLFAMGMMSEVELAERLGDSMEEHFADVTALYLSLNACNEGGGGADQMWLTLTYAGAELALQIWGVMQQIGLDFVDGVHPPALQRIAALRSSLREWCETDETFEAIAMAAKVIERTFHEVGQIIVQPGDHAATFETEADSLVVEFRRLLDSCSNALVPDYSTFYTEAPALLSRGYPESVLQRVFVDVVDGFKEAMSQDLGGTDKAEVIKRFSQYKLLFGLAEHMPAPAKLVYQAALDRIKD
ncbi:hypothetical protein GR157_36155 [Burkholderia sp. 4701]|nr:hypothetical protein [Burkholderia sp. 4701]MXN87224.1 hypothetical protein [Burkholderia sp. 4812]